MLAVIVITFVASSRYGHLTPFNILMSIAMLLRRYRDIYACHKCVPYMPTLARLITPRQVAATRQMFTPSYATPRHNSLLPIDVRIGASFVIVSSLRRMFIFATVQSIGHDTTIAEAIITIIKSSHTWSLSLLNIPIVHHPPPTIISTSSSSRHHRLNGTEGVTEWNES